MTIKGIKLGADQRVYGVSVINHYIRLKAGITIAEYVLIEAIEKLNNKRPEGFYMADVYRYTGLSEEQIRTLVGSLTEKNFLVKQNDKPPMIAEKWIRLFDVEDFEFERFWAPMTIEERTIRWTGSKEDAKLKYTKVRKEYSYDYLLHQKELYFKVVINAKFDRQVMGASVFLNMKTKRFTEDFNTQLKELLGDDYAKKGKETVKLSTEQIKNLFE